MSACQLVVPTKEDFHSLLVVNRQTIFSPFHTTEATRAAQTSYHSLFSVYRVFRINSQTSSGGKMAAPIALQEPDSAPLITAGQLDEYQIRFIQGPDENVRLLAPAGSGKTQSLLWRCAELNRRHEGRSKFLLVTFTRAARDELRSRLATQAFQPLANAVEVVTLNGWGFRRVRANHKSPRVIASTHERRLCLNNTLQPAWREHATIPAAVHSYPFKTWKVLMEMIDGLKSFGFDHEEGGLAHANQRIDELLDLGLLSHIEKLIDEMKELGILADSRLETFVETLFPFWVTACQTLIDQATFTLDDQKYVAFLDVRRQIAEGRKPLHARAR